MIAGIEENESLQIFYLNIYLLPIFVILFELVIRFGIILVVKSI